jgi:gingipain R
MLTFCFLLSAALASAQQWVGVNSQSPAEPYITTSGSTGTSSEITVEIPGFYMQEALFEGKSFSRPQISGGHPMLVQGSPDLQKLSYTLQLPLTGTMEVSIASSQYIDYTDIDIIPSAGNIMRDGSVPSFGKNNAYKSDTFFPGKLFELQQPYRVRNERSQSLQVFPFQYNPVTRVLRVYYEITLTILNTGQAGENQLKYEDYRIKAIEGIAVNSINHQASALKSSKLPSEHGSMLIICPENFKKAIQPLADWRKQTGVATEIINAEQFSDAEALYNFVKNYYYANGNLAYLLLAGDAAQVPTHQYPYGSSDNYYSYLAGNDHYPDILVGRFSAETIKDIETQVSRTLQYEQNPATDASWLTTATGIGSTLGPGDDGESDFQHIRNLLKEVKTTSYTQSNEFFDGSQGEGDADGNPSTDDIIKKINQGTGIIFYAGHGSPSIMATGSITRTTVENLTNNDKYPLIWAAACENGNFADKYCIAEAWLRAANTNGQPTGALAAVMASGSQTSYPPMEAQDKIAEILSNPQEETSTMGAVTAKGMMSMNDVYGSAGYATTDTWILFGDPSLRIRTAVPKQFIVDHKGIIGVGKTFYTLSCNSAQGFACISHQGTILGTAAIEDGKAAIYLDQPASGNELTLTITALNYLPYIDTIHVIHKPGSLGTCIPVNHSRLQPINNSFSWESIDGGTPDYYLFYLGTDNPPTNLVNGQKLTAAQIKTQFNFKYNSTYYWKVVPVNAYGSAEAKVMDFTTIFAPDEDFEPVFKSKSLWSNNGTQDWRNDGAEYFDGTHSLRSGQIGNNESSSLSYPCEVSGCDFVSFWSKTSSEQGDKLMFSIDGSTVGEWSGLTDWNYHSYKVEPGMHLLEWRYTKNGEAVAGSDAAWIDNIHLPVHLQATSNVPETGSVCANSVFETSATAENYYNITWQTEGDGTFDDANLVNPVYKPGILDLQNGNTKLQMHVNGYEGCRNSDNLINLEIQSLPVINLPSDTIASNGNSILLDATIAGDMTYSWQPDGSTSSSIIIDSLASVNGKRIASVTITSSKGCSASKTINVHFNNPAVEDSYSIYPNPSHGIFTIEPAKGASVIDRMKLVDSRGNIVWNNEKSLNIIGSKQISIAGLTGGTYVLVTENKNGRSVNPLVIQ